MLEFYEPGAAIIEDSVAKTVAGWSNSNKCILNFMFGAQKAMLEEMMFVGKEILDRALTASNPEGHINQDQKQGYSERAT